MVSIEKVSEKLFKLDEFLGLLHKISATPLKKFLKDKLLLGSTKYYLQVSIECCLDITILFQQNGSERRMIMPILSR